MPQTMWAARGGRRGPARVRRAVSGLVVLTLVSMLAAAVAAVGARPVSTGAQDDALRTAAVVPETVLFYAAINLDTASEQFTLSADLWERSGLAALLASQTEGEEMLGDEDLADLEPFLGGEAGIIATDLPASEDLPLEDLTGTMTGGADPATAVADVADIASTGGFAAIIAAPDPDAAFAKAEELLAEGADEAGADVETTDYEGVEISSVAGDEDGATDPMAIARVGDFVVLAGQPADIEPVVDVEAGTTPALADNDDFSTLRDELNAEFMLWAYINGPGLREAIATGATTEDLGAMQAALTDDTLAALDAYTSVVMYAASNGFRLDTISIPTTDAPVPGGQNFDPTFDERVPSDTLLFINGVDIGQNPILRLVALLFAQGVTGEEGGEIPEGTDAEAYAEEQFEAASQILGFNLETDLIDQLTGEFVLALSVSNLLSPDGISGVIASSVDDPSTVGDAVSKIALIVAAGAGDTTTVSTREVGEATINVVEDSSSGLPLTIEYGVVEGRLIIGLGNGLDQFVEGPAESLADNPTYQTVMGELPAEHGASAYVDMAQVIAFIEFFLAASGGADTGGGFEDASPDCGEYETQEEAQEAYDDDPGSLIDLDQDFDGEACEDFFADEASPEAPAPDFSAIQAFATVLFERDDLRGSSTILYIPE